jgi:hypothetical protein
MSRIKGLDDKAQKEYCMNPKIEKEMQISQKVEIIDSKV